MADAEKKTGVDVLREALKQRALKGSLAYISRDLSVPVHNLNDFVFQGASLPPATLQSLAENLFGGAAVYDVVSNLLRSANKAEPITLAPARPEPFVPSVEHLKRHQNLRVAPGMPSQIAPKSRPGWAE